MQAVLNEMDALGATLVALTPQLPEHNQAMRDKNALNFHLLSDPGNAYAAELGLRFELPPTQEGLLSFGVDLPKYNGDQSWTLPVPARLVVDCMVSSGRRMSTWTTRRPEPTKTIEDLKAIV